MKKMTSFLALVLALSIPSGAYAAVARHAKSEKCKNPK